MGGKLVVRPNRGRIARWLSFFCRSMTVRDSRNMARVIVPWVPLIYVTWAPAASA